MSKEKLLLFGEQIAAELAGLPSLSSAEQSERLHRLRGSAVTLGLNDLAAQLESAEAQTDGIIALAQIGPDFLKEYIAALHEAGAHR